MARTAEQELVGDAVEQSSLGADYYLGLPYGQGGARLFVLGYSSTPYDVHLPDARQLQVGGEPQFVLACAENDFDVRDAGGNLVASMTNPDCVEFRLLDNSTEAGVWDASFGSGFEQGVPIPVGRVFFDVVLDRNITDFNLRTHCITAFGYDGTSPAVVRCTIAANRTLGSTSTSGYGFDTGGFGTGSAVLLTVESGASITGKGGAGGQGGSVVVSTNADMPQPGQQGGVALRVQDNTVLVNYGRIQGGGGGGGGGAALSSPANLRQAGGGGGGGAGWYNTGLTGGNNGVGGGAFPGGRGTLEHGGLGGSGYVAGGDGGEPGTAGAASTGGSGAAGDAIQRATAKTLTKIVAGTITGAETTY